MVFDGVISYGAPTNGLTNKWVSLGWNFTLISGVFHSTYCKGFPTLFSNVFINTFQLARSSLLNIPAWCHIHLPSQCSCHDCERSCLNKKKGHWDTLRRKTTNFVNFVPKIVKIFVDHRFKFFSDSPLKGVFFPKNRHPNVEWLCQVSRLTNLAGFLVHRFFF